MTSREDALNRLTGTIVDAAFQVHTGIGPGLLERAYKECLVHELRKRGHFVETEVPVAIVYEDLMVDRAFRIDLLVEGKVVVEVKAVAEVLAVHEAQLLTYLRMTDKRVGLLLNFNVPLIKQGITRIVN